MNKLVSVFVLISIFAIGCSQKNDKDFYEEGQNALKTEEYSVALTNFQKIVDEFPNSEFYKYALLQTGELNHGLVNKQITKEDSEKAMKAFAEYHSKFKDDEKAPQALFMVGYILANELGNIDEAKKVYTKFIELYPNSEMAVAAKSEIENLGLTPEEILEKSTKR